MYLSRSKLQNPCNVTIRITRSCDTVLWLINQNGMKPQPPVEDLCIFFTTRLPCGTNTLVVCLTAFPSRNVFCHVSRRRIHTRTEKRRRFQSKRVAVSCGSFSHLCRRMPLKVGDFVPVHALCMIWYTNSTQRFFLAAVAHQ